jgi:hypothetical protein
MSDKLQFVGPTVAPVGARDKLKFVGLGVFSLALVAGISERLLVAYAARDKLKFVGLGGLRSPLPQVLVSDFWRGRGSRQTEVCRTGGVFRSPFQEVFSERLLVACAARDKLKFVGLGAGALPGGIQ